ncbi:MAG: PhnD/SsuA/transferrin family substrate-binding protein [Myxococcales bacterium]|nr:PhnD/SsuA/transferrin family substrate-binding protein [Myxococcales bacterium]
MFSLSLPMYDLPEIRWATDALADRLRTELDAAGFSPIETNRWQGTVEDLWNSPSLLLSQACGYPLRTELRNRATPVGTPVYAAPGCDGANYRSAWLAREPETNLEAFRHRRAAFNSTRSHSGYNVLRYAVAPLAKDGRFFTDVIETGSHIASIERVVAGEADVAAIDTVTLELCRRHRPELIRSTHVVGWSEPAAALPFITRTGREPSAIHGAIRRAIEGLRGSGTLEALLLQDVILRSVNDYDRILEMEQDAFQRNYGRLA